MRNIPAITGAQRHARLQQRGNRQASRESLRPDLPETMGILLLTSNLIAAFSNILGGYLDVAAILAIAAVCLLRDGRLRFTAPMFIASGLAFAYGIIWTLSCTPVTCGPAVLSTGRGVWQFAIYLFFFALLRMHGIVKLTPKVVLASILFFFAFLAVNGQFTLLESLRGLSASQFFNSYRFGIDNQINNINFFALLCASLTPFAFPRHTRDLVGYSAMVLIAIVIIATYSRSALLLFGALSAMSGYYLWRFNIGQTFALIALLLAGYAVISSLGYFEQRAFDFESDQSIVARMRVFGLLSEFAPMGNKAALSEHFVRRGALDNSLLRHVVGGGLLVLLLVVALGPAVVRSVRQWSGNVQNSREALALFGWLVAVFFDDTFFTLWGAFLIGNFVVPQVRARARRPNPMYRRTAIS